jgi:hypothetical protein
MPEEARAAMTRTDAEHIYNSLQSRADRARAAGAATGAQAGPPVSRWDWPAVAALLVPVVLLVVAALT